RMLVFFVLCILIPGSKGIELTEMYGAIQSPNFPESYPKDSEVTWNISVPDGFKIKLYFMHFDLEPSYLCEYDYVKLEAEQESLATFCGREDTDTEQTPRERIIICGKLSNMLMLFFPSIKAGEREFGPLCGDRSPAKIETGNNSVQIIFHSDNSGENIGWRMSYTAVGTPCPNPVPPVNGKIEPVAAHYSFKDQVLITCDPGYNVLKDDIETEHHQIQCQRDGSWSSFIPICKIVDCQTPADLEKGFVTYGSSNNLTVYGSSIQYSCKEPIYQMYPKINSSYVCGEKGAWTNEEFGTELPSCMAVILENKNLFLPPFRSDLLPNILSACGEPLLPLPGLLKRIVGGRSAEPGYFPWQVLIMVQDMSRVPEDKWFGSGALLSESWVLTAAHVLRSQRRDSTVIPVAEDHVVVYLGLHNVHNKANAVNRSVEKIILHEDFDPRIYNNDIALVKLKKKVSMNPFIMPICLPPTNQESSSPQPNTLGLVAGWGISNPNISMDYTVSSDLGTVSDVLQYVKLPVVLQTECQSSYASRSGSYNITDNMFCAGFYEGGKDTCLGDSGGAFTMEDPKTKRWVVQGLVSWGGPEECGSQRVYGVYTKVANYGDWLGNKLDMKGLW
ncbi:MASP1 protease, partial [Amia calva]|nr:MASP1 protease [Amia calva]